MIENVTMLIVFYVGSAFITGLLGGAVYYNVNSRQSPKVNHYPLSIMAFIVCLIGGLLVPVISLIAIIGYMHKKG
jgi:hypothetical protein